MFQETFSYIQADWRFSKKEISEKNIFIYEKAKK